MSSKVKITIVFDGRNHPVMTIEHNLTGAAMGSPNLKDLREYITDLRKMIGQLPKAAGDSA